jgi:quinol monooxygenase YgiN
MVYVLVRFTVENVEKWKGVFTEAAALRKKYGSKGVRAFSQPDKPNELLILGEYEDVQRARELFQSDEFREATKRAGVQGPPEVTMLNEVVQLPS